MISIPTDVNNKIDCEKLILQCQALAQQNIKILSIVGIAGTTETGNIDPLTKLAEIAQQFDCHFHVDAAWGGPTLLSSRHKHLLKGIERADSVAWNPHKMMGVPLSCSALLMREKGRLVETHGMNADYLFHEGNDHSWDLGDRGLQCGRKVDALKLWFSWQVHGDRGYERRIDHLFEVAASFREVVRAREGFRLIREQEGANVCFRFLPQDRERTDEINEAILDEVNRSGRIFLSHTRLRDRFTIRVSIGNPRQTMDHVRRCWTLLKTAAASVSGT